VRWMREGQEGGETTANEGSKRAKPDSMPFLVKKNPSIALLLSFRSASLTTASRKWSFDILPIPTRRVAVLNERVARED